MEVIILPKPHLPRGIALSCIGDGFLNPLLWRPFKVTSDNIMPVKSISSLINTSCVRGLSSNTWAVWRGILVQQNINEIICEVIIYNTQAKELQKSKHPGDIQLSLRIQPLKHNTPKPPIMPIFSINEVKQDEDLSFQCSNWSRLLDLRRCITSKIATQNGEVRLWTYTLLKNAVVSEPYCNLSLNYII
jgi:hypothetical protein